MKKNIPTVTIGTVALNEEQNINNLLRSVIDQRQVGYVMKEIIVISDGSNDRTVSIARSFRSSRVKVIAYKKRQGKSEHLNELFKESTSDVLVLFDADVVLASKLTIHHLIQPIINNSSVGLVGGNPLPIAGKTYIEKAVNASFDAYKRIRRYKRGGNSIYRCDGRILALSREFKNSITIPSTMIANDAFMYFACLTRGMKFRHTPKAVVWFRSPATISDQIKQNTRFIAARYRLKRYYGNLVDKEYFVPKYIVLTSMFNQYIAQPLLSSIILLINLYCRCVAKTQEQHMDAKWRIALTSKRDII